MLVSEEVKKSISESVLCWLATSNEAGEPNCSPKEVFVVSEQSEVIIANIASPESVKNIRVNSYVCVSFIHIFKQKGYKVKGCARYIQNDSSEFADYFSLIESIVGNTFAVQGVIVVKVNSISPIIAPSYYMVEGTTEASQIVSAKKAYGV